MKAAIIYTSITGNTEQVMDEIKKLFEQDNSVTDIYRVGEFPLDKLAYYEVVIVGTYSWDNGDLPLEMEELYDAFEHQEVGHIITAVFGTGDRFYPHFCGAVDLFRDMLYVHTNLAVTLKIELTPQQQDFQKCRQFYNRIRTRFEMLTNNRPF